jgi:hypothetical protein
MSEKLIALNPDAWFTRTLPPPSSWTQGVAAWDALDKRVQVWLWEHELTHVVMTAQLRRPAERE